MVPSLNDTADVDSDTGSLVEEQKVPNDFEKLQNSISDDFIEEIQIP